MPVIQDNSLVIELEIAEQLGIIQMLEQAGIPIEGAGNPPVQQPPMPGEQGMGGSGMPPTGMESMTGMGGPPQAKKGMKVGPGSTPPKNNY